MERQQIEKVIIEVVADIMDLSEEEISRDTNVKEIGANSIDRMDIISDSLEKLNLNLPMVNFANFKTVGDLAELIEKEM